MSSDTSYKKNTHRVNSQAKHTYMEYMISGLYRQKSFNKHRSKAKFTRKAVDVMVCKQLLAISATHVYNHMYYMREKDNN